MTLQLFPNAFSLGVRNDGSVDSRDKDGDGVIDSNEGGGGGADLTGFTAESDFSVVDNEDGTWTITDAQNRFGTKPNGAKPNRVFEWGSNGSLTGSSKGRYTGIAVQNGISVVNTESNTGDTHSLELAYTNNSISAVIQVDQDSSTEWYAFFTRKHNFTADEQFAQLSSWNLKYMAYQTELDTNKGPFVACSYAGDGGAGNPRTQTNKAENKPNGTDYADNDVVPLDDKLWHPEELYAKTSSSAGAVDAEYKWLRDGKIGNSRVEFVSHDTGELPYKYFKLMRKEDMISSSKTYVGFLVIEDSQCMPFISDQSTWVENATTTHIKEPQITSAWAAGSITVYHRQGAHSSLSGKTLYVRKSDGTVLKVGGWS